MLIHQTQDNRSDKRAITALIPIRNGGQWIAQLRIQLEACLSRQDEILFVNDGSTDSTQIELTRWAKEDTRLKILTSNGKGLVAALNLGVIEAANDWIARFDVDDLYKSTRITSQLSLLQPVSESLIGAIFTDYIFRDQNNNYLGYMPSAIFPEPMALSLVSSQRTPHPSVLLNRAAVIDSGMYKVEDTYAEDLGLWLRMAHNWELRSVPEPILEYTLHSNSVSLKNNNEMLQSKSRVFTKWGLNRSSIEKCSIEFKTIAEEYSKFSFADARVLLFVRDLKIANELVPTLKVPNWDIINYYLRPDHFKSALMNLLHLQSEKRLRANIRSKSKLN